MPRWYYEVGDIDKLDAQPETKYPALPVQSLSVKIARELEMRLERLVDGLSAALFRGRMHPVDLANRLTRFIDLNVEDGVEGPEIANQYVVGVNPAEIDPSMDLDRLATELARVVTDVAAENGWRIGGPIRVRISPDDKVAQGSISCAPKRSPGAVPPWSQLIETAGGETHEVGDNRVILGRAADADVRISHQRVSRHHAVLFREAGSVWISDSNSANGTHVNEQRIGTKPAELRPGDIVSLGPTTFSLRLL